MKNETLLKNIKAACKSRNITVAQFLKELGLPKSNFTAWEQRGTVPSADILFRISQYFNLPMELMLGGYDSTIDDDLIIALIKLRELSKEEREPIISLIINQVDFFKAKKENAN